MDKWGRLAWTAKRQYGVVTLRDARQAGVSDDALEYRAREQRWERPYPGVYVMPGHPETLHTGLMAAVLFLGDGAAVARRSAAQLWGVIESPPSVPDLVVGANRRPGRATRLAVVRSATLVASDVTRVGPLPVTRIDRTLCDLAGVLGDDELREALAVAGQRSMTWVRRTILRADELPYLRGRAVLLRAARDVLGEGPTDSPAERRLRRTLRAAGLRPAPGVYPVRDGDRLVAVVDIAFPEERVAVEVDGFAYHATPAQLRADHRRQNRLVAAGWVVQRVDAGRLTDPGPLIAELRALLRSRAAATGRSARPA